LRREHLIPSLSRDEGRTTELQRRCATAAIKRPACGPLDPDL
jgi:hypothetical protein